MKMNAEDWEDQRRIDTGLSNTELLKPLKTIYARVVQTCLAHPAVKGNYFLLARYYYRDFHGFSMSRRDFELLKTLPSPESIGRLFRKAVENGEVVPTEKMKARRNQRERVMAVEMVMK